MPIILAWSKEGNQFNNSGGTPLKCLWIHCVGTSSIHVYTMVAVHYQQSSLIHGQVKVHLRKVLRQGERGWEGGSKGDRSKGQRRGRERGEGGREREKVNKPMYNT